MLVELAIFVGNMKNTIILDVSQSVKLTKNTTLGLILVNAKLDIQETQNLANVHGVVELMKFGMENVFVKMDVLNTEVHVFLAPLTQEEKVMNVSVIETIIGTLESIYVNLLIAQPIQLQH